MAWLPGWSKRIKITIDNTNVDSDLTWFPATIFLGTSVGQTPDDVSAIFDEVGANSKKIAVTKADGTTELYVEIEQWDSGSELAVLHISRDGWTVAGASTTDIYIYYDNTHADNTVYIGDIDSVPGGNVWNGNFVAVLHMVDATTSTIKDSTSNSNDGTKKGANEPIEAAGKIHKGQTFDGVDDYIDLANEANFDFDSDDPFSIEAFCKTSVTGTEKTIVCKGLFEAPWTGWELSTATSDFIQSVLIAEWSAPDQAVRKGTVDICDGAWHYNAMTYDGSLDATHIGVYADGVDVGEAIPSHDTLVGSILTNYVVRIGMRWPSYPNRYTGTLDEIRISDAERSAAWIKATYYSLIDDLLTFGSEETAPPTYIPKVIMIQFARKNKIYRRLKNLWVPQLKKLWLPIPPVGVPKRIMVT